MDSADSDIRAQAQAWTDSYIAELEETTMSIDPITCDCSDEYGPCEQHCETLVVRQGAALHTADELALIRASDCEDCGAAMGEQDSALYRRLSDQLAADTDQRSGCGWFADPDDSESAYELADAIESRLPDGVRLYSDDGYVIVRLSPDCPLIER